MAPKFALFTKGSKLPLNRGFKNIFELYYSLAINPQYVASDLGLYSMELLSKVGTLSPTRLKVHVHCVFFCHETCFEIL